MWNSTDCRAAANAILWPWLPRVAATTPETLGSRCLKACRPSVIRLIMTDFELRGSRANTRKISGGTACSAKSILGTGRIWSSPNKKRLKLYPNRFEVFIAGEIGRHRSGLGPKRATNGCSKHSQKIVKRDAAKVGRTEQEPIAIQAVHREISQLTIVILNSEDFRFSIS
jgi:hypothetical protein